MKLFALILLIFLPLFLLRYSASQLKFNTGDRIRIATTLQNEPSVFKNIQLLYISGNPGISVFIPRFPEYHYGDKIKITGTIKNSEKGLQIESPEIELLETRSFLPNFRRETIDFFNRALPLPESALAAGITIGAKETLPKDFKEELTQAGLLHIVVASGMNVTIVARTLINALVLFLNRRKAIFFALAGIWSYVFLIGPDAPIIRAAVMGSLAFSAEASGKVYWAWWGLFLSAALMLLFWPFWITDLGFLLSFAATSGILAFEKPVRSYLSEKLRYIPALFRDNFATSTAAQAAVSPILWFTFGQFSPWSPFVNSAVLWTIGPIMSIASLAAIIGLLIEGLGRAIILLSYPLLWYFVKIAQIF